MVFKIAIMVASLLLSGCITITTTIEAPKTNPSYNSVIEKTKIIERGYKKKENNKSLSFDEFFSYIGLVEHDNNPSLVLHKNHDENTYTLYGVYPYTKLPCSDIIRQTVKKHNSIHKKSKELYRNDKVMECIKDYYLKIYNRLHLNRLKKELAKLYGAFYIHTGSLSLAKKYLKLSKGNVKEFMRLTILYYARLNKRKYLVGWINRVFK